jgi:LPXTG-motif cell wall-anchored protein
VKITKWAAVAALGVAGALALAGTAQADQDDATAACPASSFVAYEWPTGTPGPASSSTVTGDTVTLTKPAGSTGTSAEIGDWGITATTITVDYQLSDDASTGAGAVRLFAYHEAGADTSSVAPAAVSIAEGSSGTLELNFGGPQPVGTAGLTYDASNDSAGTVVFSNLRVDGEPASFVRSADCDPDPEPSADPTVEPTDPAGDPEETAAPGQGAGKELPKTSGVTLLPWLIAGGVGALLLGTGAFVATRRRLPQ